MSGTTPGTLTVDQVYSDLSPSTVIPEGSTNPAAMPAVAAAALGSVQNGQSVSIGDIAPGATVGLSAGTTVGLSAGAAVGLSAGATVGISAGSTVAPRAPQSVRMTVLQVAANSSVLAAALNPTRKSIQILNIGLGQATAMTFQTVGTGTLPTVPGQPSATGNVVTAGQGYPLQPAAVAGQQGGSTPIYDGAGVSTDEWDVATGPTATTILIVEGI